MCIYDDRGITLIDLIITIAILGILLSIALPNLSRTIDRSKVVAMEMNSKFLLSIIQSYNGEQTNTSAKIRNTTITSMEDITIEDIKLRIPDDFDWDMIYPIYVDSDGKGSIVYEK